MLLFPEVNPGTGFLGRGLACWLNFKTELPHKLHQGKVWLTVFLDT